MWGERLLTPPAGKVLSIEEVKRFLRIDDQESDIELLRLITVATERCQNLTRRQFLTATRLLSVRCFPPDGLLHLPWAPLQAVVNVGYYDGAGALQSLSFDEFDTLDDREPGALELKTTKTWPTTTIKRMAVEVEYDCGYGDASTDVPEVLRHAVLMTVGHLYEYRSDATKQPVQLIPNGIKYLLDQYTVGDEFLRYDVSRG